MLASAPVAVVLPTTDLGRSKDFYENKLGLKLRDGAGPLIFEAGDGTLMQIYYRPGGVKPEHTVATTATPTVMSAIPDSLSLCDAFIVRSSIVICPSARAAYLYRSTNDRLRRLTAEFRVL